MKRVFLIKSSEPWDDLYYPTRPNAAVGHQALPQEDREESRDKSYINPAWTWGWSWLMPGHRKVEWTKWDTGWPSNEKSETVVPTFLQRTGSISMSGSSYCSRRGVPSWHSASSWHDEGRRTLYLINDAFCLLTCRSKGYCLNLLNEKQVFFKIPHGSDWFQKQQKVIMLFVIIGLGYWLYFVWDFSR